MARRRALPGALTNSTRNRYDPLIVIGICITFTGIFSTSYLAILEGARAPFQAWITGSMMF